ncbi:MAG: TA system VapC family ribonuclease toxin [Pirellulales bacterium]
MYLPDVNVWVAQAFFAHAHHDRARTWFDRVPANRLCNFCRVTQMGFLRIANNPAAMGDSVVSQDQAWQLYDHFLGHQRVVFAEEPAGLEAVWRRFTAGRRFSPKLWNDAYLAAFAETGGYEIVSFDQGFSQYKGLHSTILS